MIEYEIICIYCNETFKGKGETKEAAEEAVYLPYRQHECPYKPKTLEEQIEFATVFMDSENYH